MFNKIAILGLASIFIFATPVMAAIVHPDYSKNLTCTVKDHSGQLNVYHFAVNTYDDRHLVSSMIETGYSNNRGKNIVREGKDRPVWSSVIEGPDKGITLTYTPDPEWTLRINDLQLITGLNGELNRINATVILYHKLNDLGHGDCNGPAHLE